MNRAALQLAAFHAALLPLSAAASARTPLPVRTDRSVYDGAAVIDDASEARLEALDRELYDKTGVAIVIVTVARLEDETIDELAVRVGHDWGVGQKGRDRGLVVALSRADRKIFVATGYGTEGYLPDGRVGELLDQHALPALRADRFSEAVLGLTTALATASAREYGAVLTGAPESAAQRPEPFGFARLVFAALAILVFGYLAVRHPGLLLFFLLAGRGGRRGGSGFGGGGGFGGFRGGGFGGGGAGRGF